MATRWSSPGNPLSWITRRRNRRSVVVPGGPAEYTSPAEYTKTTQDDYSAADMLTQGNALEWFAVAEDQPSEFGQEIPKTATMNPPRPRTLKAEYDESSQTLRITFREGASYDYPEVTPAQWASLQRERYSTGKWLARNGLGGPGSGVRV